MSYDFDREPRGLPTAAKVALGCGAMAFVGLMICAGVGFMGLRIASETLKNAEVVLQEAVEKGLAEVARQADAFSGRFEAEGYQRVTGQVLDITADVPHSTVYTVQVLNLQADVEGSLAILAQAADIDGTINGDLTFYGQSLTIHEGAVIKGNLNIEMVQKLENHGTVEGEIIRQEATPFDPTLPESPSDPEASSQKEASLKPSPGDVIDTETPETSAAPESGNTSEDDVTSPADGEASGEGS